MHLYKMFEKISAFTRIFEQKNIGGVIDFLAIENYTRHGAVFDPLHAFVTLIFYFPVQMCYNK